MVTGTLAVLLSAGIGVVIISLLSDVFSGLAADILMAAIGSSNLDDILKLLSFNSTDGSEIFSYYWNAISGAFDIIKPFGIALISTYFILHMYDMTSKDQITIDSLIRSLISLILAIGIFGNLDVLVNTFISIAEAMLYKFQSAFSANSWGNTTLDGYITSAGFTSMSKEEITQILVGTTESSANTGLGLFLQSIVIWLIHQIAVIAIDLAAISRAIEIGWRTIFAPIGCANAFEGGANSAAIKYLKSLAGVILAGPAMYIIAVLGYNISFGIFAFNMDGFGLFASAAAILATAGAAIGIGTKVKEVIA